jgi:hypothetical protein
MESIIVVGLEGSYMPTDHGGLGSHVKDKK